MGQFMKMISVVSKNQVACHGFGIAQHETERLAQCKNQLAFQILSDTALQNV